MTGSTEVCRELEWRSAEQKTPASANSSRNQRTQAETFWRSVLEDHLPQTWFDELPQDLTTQFNLKTVQEVYKTPLPSLGYSCVPAEDARTSGNSTARPTSQNCTWRWQRPPIGSDAITTRDDWRRYLPIRTAPEEAETLLSGITRC